MLVDESLAIIVERSGRLNDTIDETSIGLRTDALLSQLSRLGKVVYLLAVALLDHSLFPAARLLLHSRRLFLVR